MFLLLHPSHPVFTQISQVLIARGHTIVDATKGATALVYFVECVNCGASPIIPEGTENLPIVIVGDFTVPQTVPQKACLIDINTGEVVDFHNVIAAA